MKYKSYAETRTRGYFCLLIKFSKSLNGNFIPKLEIAGKYVGVKSLFPFS